METKGKREDRDGKNVKIETTKNIISAIKPALHGRHVLPDIECRGPCCAWIKKRRSGAMVRCCVKRAPLYEVYGSLTSVKAFLCARHRQRPDIRGRRSVACRDAGAS